MEHMNIFRQYDIRGNAVQELNESMVRGIARSFAKYISQKGRNQLIIGRDNRSSSVFIRNLVVQELIDSGLDVIDIGEVITPMFYFACRYIGIDAGIMITASHNPAQDNGFKLLLGNSTIYGEEIQVIAEMVKYGKKLKSVHKGKLKEIYLTEEYIEAIKQRIVLSRPLKIVVDCGNGTAGFHCTSIIKGIRLRCYRIVLCL